MSSGEDLGERALVTGMHFERLAGEYAGSRPPYPSSMYELLEEHGVTGSGTRLLEIGPGACLATRELVRSADEVVAVEPGSELARLLVRDVPEVSVIPTRLEDADLPSSHFDSAVAATSMHWVDLDVALPKLHAALRPGGLLAVWRHRFGDSRVETEFRRRVQRIVAQRDSGPRDPRVPERPTMDELAAGGWFEPVTSERWAWSIDLGTAQVRKLFRTFSDWSVDEVDAVAAAADELGGVVTEHYQTVLHLLRRVPRGTENVGGRP